MGDCDICGEGAVYICVPCKLIFCYKHKAIHEKRKLTVHLSRQTALILISNPLKSSYSEKTQLKKSSLIYYPHNQYSTDMQEHCSDQFANIYKHFKKSRLMQTNDAVSALAHDYQIFLEAHTSGASDFLITYDNKYIISCIGKVMKIWNFESYRQEAILKGHDARISCMTSSRDSKYIVTGSADKTIRIWNLITRTQESVLQGHDRTVFSVRITNDNKYIISTSFPLPIRIWNFQNKNQEYLINEYVHRDSSRRGMHDLISFTDISNNEKYLISPFDDGILVWNLQEKVQETVLIMDKIGKDQINVIVLSSDSQFIIAGYKHGSIIIWNREESKQEAVLEGYNDVVYFLHLTMDNKYIVSGTDHVRIWNFHLKTLEAVLPHGQEVVDCLTVTSDDKYIIYALSDYSIRIWDFQGKQKFAVLKGHTSFISKIAVTRYNDRIITNCNGRTIRIWSLHEKRLLYTLPGHNKPVASIAISRDNKYILSGSFDCTLRIWNTQEKTQETVLIGHTGCVTCVGFTSDNKHILSASNDKTVRIWKLRERRLRARINGNIDSAVATTNCHNYKYIAPGSNDKIARRWIILTWKMKRKGAILKVGVKGMKSIVITPCRKYIVSGFGNDTLRVWKLSHSLKNFFK